MIRVDAVWLALGASNLRGGINRLLAMVVRALRWALWAPKYAATWKSAIQNLIERSGKS